MRTLGWFWAASLLALMARAAAQTSAAVDAGLLLVFKGSFANGAEVLSSWRGANPCGGWLGVTCSGDGQVTELDMYGLGLQGTIPPDGGWALPDSLTSIDLAWNALEGSLTPSWVLPTSLVQLSLTQNDLTGGLPPAWQLPAGLQSLSLSFNQLGGNLSVVAAEWALPEGLQTLSLMGNQLTASLPPEWGTSLPAGLRLLELANNSLTGALPVWNDLPNLDVSIKPGNEELCGDVPVTPQYTTSTPATVDLEPLPACPATAPGPPGGNPPDAPPGVGEGGAPAPFPPIDAELLLDFKASLDNSDAVLQNWVGSDPCVGWTGVLCNNAGEVTAIGLSNTGLVGSFPAEGFALPATLEMLNLANNLLAGSLPSSWALPATLSRMELYNNDLSGTLPEWPDFPQLNVSIAPGNADVCGSVPTSPQYNTYNRGGPDTLLTSLPSCPQTQPSPPAGSPGADGEPPPSSPGADGEPQLSPSPSPPPSSPPIPLQPSPPPPLPPSSPSSDSSPPAPSNSSAMELQALRASFTNGDSVLSDWEGEDPCAGWTGVECSGLGLVTGIDLDGLGLLGSIPPGGWALPASTEFLTLANNQVEGQIPESWPLPASMWWLGLHNCSLTGTLPNWPDLSALVVTVLPGNPGLCGEVPASPRYFTFLLDLENPALGSGQPLLSTDLPSCGASPAPSPAPLTPDNTADTDLLLAFKSSLSNGDAVLADWTGQSPCTDWSGITCSSRGRVTAVRLPDRGLKGTIPPEGWQLPATLQLLDLHSNELSGTLPASWETLPGISALDMYNNSLSGTLPAWGPDKELVSIYVQPGNGELCGEVPASPRYYIRQFPGIEPLASLPECGRRRRL